MQRDGKMAVIGVKRKKGMWRDRTGEGGEEGGKGPGGRKWSRTYQNNSGSSGFSELAVGLCIDVIR